MAKSLGWLLNALAQAGCHQEGGHGTMAAAMVEKCVWQLILLVFCAASQNSVSLFFLCFVSSYVGYVPESDDLGIFCFVWRCEFLSKFSFVTEKNPLFVEKFLEAPDLPQQNKFWKIQK